MESGPLLPELMGREEFPIEWRFPSLNATTRAQTVYKAVIGKGTCNRRFLFVVDDWNRS